MVAAGYMTWDCQRKVQWLKERYVDVIDGGSDSDTRVRLFILFMSFPVLNIAFSELTFRIKLNVNFAIPFRITRHCLCHPIIAFPLRGNCPFAPRAAHPQARHGQHGRRARPLPHLARGARQPRHQGNSRGPRAAPARHANETDGRYHVIRRAELRQSYAQEPRTQQRQGTNAME